MKSTRDSRIVGFIGRSFVVGIGYAATCLLVGGALTIAGVPHLAANEGARQLPLLIGQGVLIGLTLGSLALRTKTSNWRVVTLWTCVLFFNSLSVAIEGMYYTPTHVTAGLPWIVVQKLLVATTTGLLVLQLFPSSAEPEQVLVHHQTSSSVINEPNRSTSSVWRSRWPLRSAEDALVLPWRRPWFSWTWRFVISAFSYVASYFVFGAVNYALVTRPYYESHVGGLVVPNPTAILAAESVRAPLIILSVLPLLLSTRWPLRPRVLSVGLVLFVVGGLVPLLEQVNTLPLFLLVASGWEIFFQNMSTGIVAALLLGSDKPSTLPVLAEPLQAPA